MAGIANITIVGNVGRDPEMRYTPNGKPVTDVNVAVSHPYRGENGEWQETTDWFRVSVWGDRAEQMAEKLKKGSKVIVIGRFKTRSYTTRDGKAGVSMEITADQITDLTPRDREQDGDSGGFRGQPAAPSGASKDDPLDDLPF